MCLRFQRYLGDMKFVKYERNRNPEVQGYEKIFLRYMGTKIY